MRLLLTTDTVGGVWTFTKDLTTELLDQGHAVALVSFGRSPSREQAAWCSEMLKSHQKDFRYEASCVPLEWMEPNEDAYTQGEPLLLRVAREFSPDVLHSSQFCFGKLPVGFPKIITAHSDVLSWGAACRPAGFDASAWLTQYCGLVQEGLLAADAVVAPTQWMLEALAGNFALPHSRHVIFNGRSLRAAHTSHPRKLQAVAVGRFWDEAKNLSLLMALDSPMPIFVAGERNNDATVDQSQVGSIQMLGKLGEDEILELFRSSSIYIAASIYEPFGLAPLEAALCGCAIVTNDIPSLREVWGNAALYFHDSSTLRTLLHELKRSPAMLKVMQAHSLQRARGLTAARMTEQYLALYGRVLGQTSAALAALVKSEEPVVYGS